MSRVASLQQRLPPLEDELSMLRELTTLLRDLPLNEANEIVQRLRSNEDVKHILASFDKVRRANERTNRLSDGSLGSPERRR